MEEKLIIIGKEVQEYAILNQIDQIDIGFGEEDVYFINNTIPYCEVIMGYLPESLKLYFIEQHNGKRTGIVDGIIKSLDPKNYVFSFKLNEYPIYSQIYRIHYFLVREIPKFPQQEIHIKNRKKWLFKLTVRVNWSNIRDYYIRGVENQNFQPTAEEFIQQNKREGYYL